VGKAAEPLKLKAQPWIDVLITYIIMPGLDGYELAEAAKRVKPDLHVILLSGRETDGRGFALIRKSFRENELTRIMSQTAGLC
jgi:DNA-binding NarL/FixJ family response regulator